MRNILLLVTLFVAAAALSWQLATPQQRIDLWFWAHGTEPPPINTDPPQLAFKQVAPAAARPALARQARPAAPAERERGHDGEEQAGSVCGGPPTLAVTDVQASRVYQFRDAEGVASFSDYRPTAAPASDVSARYRKREQYFRVRLIHDQAPDAIRMKSRIAADTQQIFLFLTQHLQVDNLRQVFLDLRLYPDKASFEAYRRSVAPKLKTSSGFYSAARNEAVVRMRSRDSRTLEVVRHETSHLIAAALFGNLPKWLNEGLAEYFERMEVDGLAKTINPSSYFLKELRQQLRRGTLPRLQQHLRLNSRQWLREDEALRYGIGWSLIYHLMAEPQGRRFLASLLDAQAAHRCQRFDTADFIEANYPGGIAGLDSDWRRRLGQRDLLAQYF